MRLLSGISGLLATGLLLSGCGAYQAHTARTALPGMNVMDLQSCAGIPSKVVQIGPDDYLLSYQFKSDDPAFSLKVLTDIDLQVGSKGGCYLTVRAREPGYVASVHYSGTEFSTEGTNAACGPLVAECTSHADRTTLPAGYSLKQWLAAQVKGSGK